MTGFRWTIKRKLLALGAGTLLPLLLVLAFWVWWEMRAYTAEAEAKLALASQQAAVQVEMSLEHATAHLEALARNPAVQRRQIGPMEQLFREVKAERPELENVFALSTDGRTFATAVSQPGGAPVSAADRPWFQRVMATGRTAVGGFQIGRITGQPVAIVAVPLRQDHDAPTGALGAALSLRRLRLLFESLPLTQGMTVTVVDGDGRVLSHTPKAEEWIGRPLPSAAALPSGRAMEWNLAWFDGGERVAAVAPVADTGWRVMVGVSRASLTAEVWGEVRAIALPLVGLLAVSGLIGLLIAMRVWRPLQALTEAVARLPEGGRISVDVRSTDEVGDLTRAFNTMAAEIEESRSKLKRRVSELEAMSEAWHLLTGTLELPAVLKRLAEIARTHLRVDVVRIWLVDSSRESLFLQAHEGVTCLEVNFRERLGLGEGLAGWIVTHRTLLILPEVLGDPRLKNREWVQAEGIVSFLGVPLILEDAPLGILACMTRERRDFAPEDAVLAEALAAQAVVAIENARLMANIRQTLDDLKTAQDQLVRTEAFRAVGEVAAGTAHHLNNILAVIGGRVEILLRSVEEPSIRRSLEIVQRAVARGAEVVRRVREFGLARPGSRAVPVDLNYLVREALELTQPRWREQAQTQGIQIEVRMEPGQIPAVAGDPVSLGEVLVNVLLNAVDALPEGGQITVKTWVSDQRVHCSVTDTGVGMSEEVRRRAAEPFFTTKGPKSTGLGLSVSYGVLQRHGGELSIESTPGRGTTVTISLPLKSDG